MSAATLSAECKPELKPAAQAQAAPAQVPPPPPAGRDARGRFVPGNPGGPGNPFARQVAQIRREILANLTSQDIYYIVETFKLKAIRGDLGAAKFLFQYAVGKPGDTVNPDTLDIEEFQQIYEPRKDIMRVANEVASMLPPAVCSGLVRALGGLAQQKITDVLAMSPEERTKVKENPAAFFSSAARPQAVKEAEEEDVPSDRHIQEVRHGENGDLPDKDDHVDEVSDDLTANAPERAEMPPSTKGGNGQAAPSTKGGNGRVGVATNGERGKPPPSAKGGNGRSGPSAKGGNGKHAARKPTTNGKNRLTLPMRRGSRF